MPRRKPEKPEPKAKPAEKPSRDWTTEEAMARLFPPGTIDAVRDRLKRNEPPPRRPTRRR